jgi:hypothetical protein
MKYFLDKQLTREVKVAKFGIVPAGEKKVLELFAQNNTKAYLRELAFKPMHREVKVLQAPVALDPGEAGKLVLEWAPSVTLEEGLDTPIEIEGAKLFGKL